MNELHKDFPETYFEAVERFITAACTGEWQTEAVSHASHDHFQTHFSYLGSTAPQRLLLISSGVHGVEGFLGSSIQLGMMQRHASLLVKMQNCAVLLVHAINPFGYERLRRVDENNVDLNRNLLVGDAAYEGAHTHYRELDPFLNPKQWPRREFPVQMQAAWQIFKHGLPALKQAIAEGQYEFPYGLFYGGNGPSATEGMLTQHLLPKLRPAGEVLHLDIHTGLGKSGTFKLLLNHPLLAAENETIQPLLGNHLSVPEQGVSYHAHGDFNNWVRDHVPQACSFCFEFGTYSPIRVLGALRAENAAYHWGDRDAPEFKVAKRRLKEMFCPQSKTWRETVLQQADELLKHVIEHWLLKC